MSDNNWDNYDEFEEFDEFDSIEDIEDIEQNPILTWGIRLIAFIILVSFLALSFPWFHHLFDETFDFMKQNQALEQDDVVIYAKPAIVSLQAVDATSSRSSGTGFIISADGKILTNAHIVENTKSVQITFSNDEIAFSNNIEVIDNHDLAIIYIDKHNLPVLPLERKESIKTGDTVTIIGNPLGYNKIAQRGTIGNWHQTSEQASLVFDIDIPIQPGNSGSPVLNDYGNVVGVVFASILITENEIETKKALAIPLETLIPILEK